MGRLDDAAKRKVVELRQAGLSFRKIKAVLELENIRVSAQAIYLYLKEFQRKKVQRGGESAAAPEPQTTPGVGAGRGDGGSREGWNDQQIRNLLREASRHAGYVAASEFAKQCPGSTPPEVRGQGPSGTGGEGASRGQSNRTEKQEEGNKEDEDIQIVSVTSLAQNSQQRGLPPAGAAAVTGAYMRKRATPSPATNPILAARKRLLDKALSHRAKRNLDGQQGASVPRQMFQQRVGGQAVRSPHPAPPRVGIRLPNPPAPPPTSQGSSPVIRLQSPGSQGMNQGLLRRDRNPSPQQAAHQETGGRCGGGGGGGGLQEQVQTLGSEIHSLSLAVRMLVEQQYRLEREQVQQTQVQRQILSTLQTLASRLEAPCTSLHQRQHPKTPPPPVLPASGSASYSQDTFPFSQGGYAQCSQAQPSYNGMDSSSLETIETFKLSGQSPHGINGFQTGSSSSTTDSLPLTHTPTYTLAHTQPYSSSYTQQPHTQTHMPSCTQSYATTYTQSHTQSYRGTDSTDYPSTSTEGALQDCMAPTQASDYLDSDITVSPQETQLNIIKVEAL
ncbi:uncharacterized protein LOC115206665 isoform X2 [Salmo trutta]|uniref:uncharacterized protein LOC115206665 isoform X2 n=1 Tax=Salmo trutta TaxID=8032 RepID=UPI001131869F|nr:uncharacterized protein LOC115206665 isoform X2 [Salmo trutta]